MGIKGWLTKKAMDIQIHQGPNPTEVIDKMLTLKAKELEKQGKPVTKEGLMAGAGALKVLSIGKNFIEARVDEFLSNRE